MKPRTNKYMKNVQAFKRRNLSKKAQLLFVLDYIDNHMPPRGNLVDKGLGSLGHTGFKVLSSNLSVNLIPETLDVSRVQTLEQARVPPGIEEQNSNSQLLRKLYIHIY